MEAMETAGNLKKKQIDLIKESICVYNTCMECRVLYREGRLCFANIERFIDDRGRSCLFRLKEMCHELYRNSDEATYKEKLYDITVGYIFHEAMKLREDLYQTEYSRQYTISNQELTPLEKKIVREIEVIVRKADKRLRGGLKEVRRLLMELMAQLMTLIAMYRDNYLLPRFIFENEKTLVKIYGRTGFGDLLNEMYQDGRSALVYKASISYLQSEYYDCARGLLKKLVRAGDTHKGVRFFYFYASAYHYYFKNMFRRALVFAERALSLEEGFPETDPYRKRLEGLVVDLRAEIGKRARV